ncbi:CIC11C00000000358 [Sungouiella intermedia]|uniref:CIC11C00000000358 n=1 Tax=Sungouiella intermedia TaxID=45354 RepID=A0A1L0BR24_9ASCO|nr:CIC11C00000000358 [[Candida] intermedia]
MVVSYDDKRIWKNIDTVLKDELVLSIISNLECLICSEVMHVPYLAQCGHSFCYGCLNSWFETKVNCPTCRTDMDLQPTLNIQLRDVSKSITDLVIECMEDEVHQKELKEARTNVIEEHEEDLRKRSLFGEAFNNAPTLVDKSDGVPRCGNCHWEAHGSVCLHCGARFRISRSDLYFDSDDGDAYNEDQDEVELYGIADDNAYDSQDSFLDNRDAVEISNDRHHALEDDILSSGEESNELWSGFRNDPDQLSRIYGDTEDNVHMVDSEDDRNSWQDSDGESSNMESAIDRIHRQDVAEYVDLSAEEGDSEDEAVTSHRRAVVVDLDSDW